MNNNLQQHLTDEELEAVKDFAKNNCLTWCQMDYCDKRLCEDPEFVRAKQAEYKQTNKPVTLSPAELINLGWVMIKEEDDPGIYAC